MSDNQTKTKSSSSSNDVPYGSVIEGMIKLLNKVPKKDRVKVLRSVSAFQGFDASLVFHRPGQSDNVSNNHVVQAVSGPSKKVKATGEKKASKKSKTQKLPPAIASVKLELASAKAQMKRIATETGGSLSDDHPARQNYLSILNALRSRKALLKSDPLRFREEFE